MRVLLFCIEFLLFLRDRLRYSVLEQYSSLTCEYSLLDESMMMYEYETLQHADSFRLLKLLPSEQIAAELRCEIADSRLGLTPDFEALSYTWDQDVFPVTLNTPSGELKVTENLASALRRFRSAKRTRTLWVDAVCINQASIPERNQQVGIMSSIFRDAKRVLCWIGEADEHTEQALTKIRQLANSHSLYGLPEVDAHMWFQIPMLDAPEVEARSLIKSAEDHHIHSVYSRRWFSRLWVVQEVTLSKQAVLCCGVYEMAWTVFATGLLVLTAATQRAGPFPYRPPTLRAYLQCWNIVRTRAKYRLLSSPNSIVMSAHTGFVMAISRLMMHDCKDQHDRIYAVLGLDPSENPITIIPDYSIPVTKLYAHLAIEVLRRGEIEILFDAGLAYRKTGLIAADGRHLPSWGPEYRRSHHVEWIDPYAWEQERFKRAIEVPPVVLVQETEDAILVRGTILDCVAFGFTQEVTLMVPQLNFASVRHIVAILVQKFQEVNPQGYPTGEESTEVLARLLLLDGTTIDHTARFLPVQTIETMIEHWMAYKEHCIPEDGEVFTKLRAAAQEPLENDSLVRFWDDKFPTSLSTEARKGWLFHRCLQHILGKCPIAGMEGGVFGMIPAGTMLGDSIAVFEGARMPYILRKAENSESYQLIGSCYIQGIMHGGVVGAKWYEEASCMIRLV
jgi:hypothetical protein